jgi:type IV secretion system protein TrbE
MKHSFIAEKIPYDRFVDEGVMRLGAGGTMVGYEITGPGHETSKEEDVHTACERFAASLTHLGTGNFIHLIAHRTKAIKYRERTFSNRAAELVDRERAGQYAAARYYQTLCRLYISNQDESAISNRLNALFFASAAHRMVGSRQLQMGEFLQRLTKWEDAIGNALKPRRMTSLQMFRDLILCVNGTDYEPPLPRQGAPLRHIIGQQDLVGGSLPRGNLLHFRPVTLVYPWPTQTTEQSLATLLTYPGELTLSCRFICLDSVDALRMGRLDQKHFNRMLFGTGFKQWIGNSFNIKTRTSFDQDTLDQIAEIDEALAEIPKGVPYGFITICAIVRGEDENDVKSRARQLTKDLAAINHGSRIEDAAAVDAIEGSWPGQGTGNDRRPLLSGRNYAEIVMPVHHWAGTPDIDSRFYPAGTAVPLQVSGSGSEPFNLPSAIRDVGHMWVVGPTTGGKSTLLGVIVSAYSCLPNIHIVWLDRDYSSYVLTHAMGGRYIELATDDSSPLCPFVTLDAPDGITFIFEWISRLLERWNLELNARQADELRRCIELARDHGVRTMTGFIHLVHDPAIRGTLRHYCQGQQWGHIFDGEPYDIRRELLCTYEMRHLDALLDRASGPAKELIIRETEVGLGKDPTVVVWDEASWALRDPTSRGFVDKGCRTFRKYNGAFILATQSMQEIESAEIRTLLSESTAIKIFLPNRSAKGEAVAKLYAECCSPKEIEMIAENMTLQQDYLCVTEYGSRVFRLDLGRIGRALCGSTGADSVARARALLKDIPKEAFLDHWLHASGLGPTPVRLIRDKAA